jgi:hypothetical protein
MPVKKEVARARKTSFFFFLNIKSRWVLGGSKFLVKFKKTGSLGKL